jgi:hypothetical protein
VLVFCSKTKSERGNLARAAGSGPSLFSRARDWADEATFLLVGVLIHEGAVWEVHERHFDSHAILNRNIEGALENAIQQLWETVGLFNEYVRTKVDR